MPGKLEVLHSRLAAEANETIAAGRVGNGKFALSTGAWYINDKYLRDRGASSGRVCPEGTTCGYKLDERLAQCLAERFAGGTVTELGGGTGHYKRAMLRSGRVRRYVAYDGVPDIERMTSGEVHWADLSAPQPYLVTSDWALSLEVAEHIPPEFEAAYLANLDAANTRGLACARPRSAARHAARPYAARCARRISWSHLSAARGQSAHGHVNAKPARSVRALFLSRGYVEEVNSTRYLRRCATFPYLRNGIMFFQRDAGAASASAVEATGRRD